MGSQGEEEDDEEVPEFWRTSWAEDCGVKVTRKEAIMTRCLSFMLVLHRRLFTFFRFLEQGLFGV